MVGAPTGEHEHGVVGAPAPVDHQGVEAVVDGLLEEPVERDRRDRGVGGEHRQHRGHGGSEHRRALGHAAHRGGGAAEVGVLHGDLADGVGGEHRVGGGDAPGRVGGELPAQLRDPGLERIHGHRADQASLAHEDVSVRTRRPARSSHARVGGPVARWRRWRCPS
jgi:hypothetical protein